MISVILTTVALSSPNSNAAFQEPYRIKADGNYIDVQVGHADPLYTDFDGDGVKDLLVGQFGQGRMRIYKNHGSNTEPLFKEFEYFKAGGDIASVPYG